MVDEILTKEDFEMLPKKPATLRVELDVVCQNLDGGCKVTREGILHGVKDDAIDSVVWPEIQQAGVPPSSDAYIAQIARSMGYEMLDTVRYTIIVHPKDE